jgi:hypothetical protein
VRRHLQSMVSSHIAIRVRECGCERQGHLRVLDATLRFQDNQPSIELGLKNVSNGPVIVHALAP